jgi:hypothetical protein
MLHQKEEAETRTKISTGLLMAGVRFLEQMYRSGSFSTTNLFTYWHNTLDKQMFPQVTQDLL